MSKKRYRQQQTIHGRGKKRMDILISEIGSWYGGPDLLWLNWWHKSLNFPLAPMDKQLTRPRLFSICSNAEVAHSSGLLFSLMQNVLLFFKFKFIYLN